MEKLTILQAGLKKMVDCNSPLEWHNCYAGQYDLWSPEAYSHPAKMSPALCFHILQHLEELGLMDKDSVVLDMMAGTGTVGLCWATKGGRSIMVELEPFFRDLIGDCHCQGVTEKLFKRMMKGTNRTRKLSYDKTRICPKCQIEVDKRRAKGGARTIFTSQPHYYDGNRGNLGKKLGHPIDMTILQGDSRHLASMLEERGLCVVTSPPYMTGEGTPGTDPLPTSKGTFHGHGWTSRWGGMSNPLGDTPGQIGKLRDKVIVTSPPYEAATAADYTLAPKGSFSDIKLPALNSNYGQSEGQIGQERNESYLDAMKICYSEAARVADVLVCVLKDPTRNGKIRLLGNDTWDLLESVGWKIIDYHYAILFQETQQVDLLGAIHRKPKGRLSFFKRLAYQKGSLISQGEHILIALKQADSSMPGIKTKPAQIVGNELPTNPQDVFNAEIKQ